MAQDPLTAEAFALSPISARATPPSEADYDAIRDAFMETMRGRWFLNEYARRNRNADTTMVLDAVARIEAGVAARIPATPSLPELIAAIRPLIAQARAATDAAMDVPETGGMVGGGRRATRIIREISWSLRETGTDPRICNILDQQLQALEALHDHVAGDPRRELIGEVFDDLILGIEDIASSGATTAHAAPESKFKSDIKPEPVETIGANADIAAAAADSAGAIEAESKPDILDVPSESEIAADDAMLGLVAIEMTAPDLDATGEDNGDGDAIAELKSLADSDDSLRDMQATMDAIETDVIEADVIEADIIEEFAPAAPPLQPSLGAALIASGIVRTPRAGDDVLAPFRRMSQVEKIAFFS